MTYGVRALLDLPKEILREILLEASFVDVMQLSLVSKMMRNLTFDILGERRITMALARLYSSAQRLLHIAPLPVSYDMRDNDSAIVWLDHNKWIMQARGPILSSIDEHPFLFRCRLTLPYMQTIQGSSSGIEALVIDSEYPYFPLNFTRKVEIHRRASSKFLRITKMFDPGTSECIAVLDARHLPCVLTQVARTLAAATRIEVKEGRIRISSSELTFTNGLADHQVYSLWATLTGTPLRVWSLGYVDVEDFASTTQASFELLSKDM